MSASICCELLKQVYIICSFNAHEEENNESLFLTNGVYTEYLLVVLY